MCHLSANYSEYFADITFRQLSVCIQDMGVARILHWGPQKMSAEGARIEAASAPRGCEDWGGGVPLPN